MWCLGLGTWFRLYTIYIREYKIFRDAGFPVTPDRGLRITAVRQESTCMYIAKQYYADLYRI